MSFFGEHLREIRERRNIQRQELANLLGVSRNTIGLWERGLSSPRSLVLVQDLADILQVPVAYFYDADEREKELRKSHVIQDLEHHVTRLEHSLKRDDSRGWDQGRENGATDVKRGSPQES